MRPRKLFLSAVITAMCPYARKRQEACLAPDRRQKRQETESSIKKAEISLSECLSAAEAEGKKIEGAILKANSPSCGAGKIYDGTFSGTLTDGYGVFASKLAQLGIEVITEKEKIKW